MVNPAHIGIMQHPTIPGAEVVCGRDWVAPWLQRYGGVGRIALDIETYGLGVDANRIKVVVLAVPESVLVLDPRDYTQRFYLEELLDDPALTEVVTHNGGPFDFPSLAANRIIGTEHVHKLVDTQLHARLAEPGETTPKTLDACAERYLGIKSRSINAMFKALGMTKTEGYARLDLDSPAYLFGAAADGIVTARLLEPIRSAAIDRLTTGHPFASIGLSRYEAEQETEKHQIANRWGCRRTIIGLKVDFDHLERFRGENGAERARNEATLNQLGIDPGNGNHLARWLTDNNLLPPDHPMTKGGKNSPPKPSTAEKVLETLNHPVARLFVATKKVTKLDGYMQKCIDQADENDRIHPSTNILKAAHGRSSISGIEIHQFPAGARGIVLFDQEPGVSVDWSQQEPRLGMNLAQGPDDPGLLAYERGERLYTAIAEYGDIPDKVAKVVLLAGMYGEGLQKLSADLGLPPDPWIEARGNWEARWGYQAGRDMQDATFGSLPSTRGLLQQLKGIAKQHRMVFTVAGRILPVPSGFYDGRFSVQTHKGPNYTICGSAADEMTDVVVWAEGQGIGDGLYWNMHDEFLCAASISHDVQRQMETPSERFKMMAGRVPVIRTDMNWNGERWIKT